jgi:hypothetical protein
METKNSSMRIAVLSGKGGTGKTLVSVNLAARRPVGLYRLRRRRAERYLFFVSDERRVENVVSGCPLWMSRPATDAGHASTFAGSMRWRSLKATVCI